MLFNSYEFIFAFLPLVFIFYFYLNYIEKNRLSKWFLVSASLFFYGWWNILYLPIILASMSFNYAIGRFLKFNVRHKKKILIIGIFFNLSLLAYFKYYDFFIENFNILFNSDTQLLYLALPLAISFFTFQQVAYLVDSYRGETKEYDFLNYALFVTFFPQLIAGPIVHHKEMMPQFVKNNYVNSRNIAMGLFIFAIGLFKKVVIADTFSIWATQGFDVSITLNMIEAWVTSLSYTFQLYFDFSGYTDMAIGIALLFNIKLPINFNSPYKALSIQDFWRRWHITLSRFLRDYIYIPLGGNRKGELFTYSNLMITFILGGLWHGAGWTFLFWGFLHGTALVIHRVWSNLGFKLWTWLAWFITFNFINISWIFFRAKEWDDALKVLEAMFSLDYIVLPRVLMSSLGFLEEFGVSFGFFCANIATSGVGDYLFIWLLLGFFITLGTKNASEQLQAFQLTYKTAFFIAFLLSSAIVGLNSVSEFLYFNF
ncbi:MAG: Probable poly(beta-D-mannuronate) O-acetylase (EC [uncultured Sulfurovum sp.]|uniref:Probable poly(Beta-D-mannuronate) O-acetylase (EC) n=1 Tax=uncultured Sulfurovum sp. TaxID=269237 RepID=A0A6S6TP77_9BACT|nr:MAG: Probable poly(beta-D-mannuronate) O-acetylase (EC [uncultured Sulfurovum sp.]